MFATVSVQPCSICAAIGEGPSMRDLARPETYTVQNKSLIVTFELLHICVIILLIYHFEFAYQIEAQISKHGYDTGEFKHILNTNIEVNFARKTFIITERYEQEDDGTKYIL